MPAARNGHQFARVATSGNTLCCNDARLGVPNNFIRRDMLEARSLVDARSRALTSHRARGSNHIVADHAGHVWDVETSATSFAFFVGGHRLVHTNHYLAPEMALHESTSSPGSRARLARAEVLLSARIQLSIEVEASEFSNQAAAEATALADYNADPVSAATFLTTCSGNLGHQAFLKAPTLKK